MNDSKEFIFPIQTDFFNIKEEYGYDLIKNIIKKINEKKLIVENNSIKYIISLKDCEDENNKDFYIKNYELKLCKKKTLMPKNNVPSYSPTSLLKEFENEKISFVSKNSLNIMLTENFSDTNDNNEPEKQFINVNDKINGTNVKINSAKVSKKNINEYKEDISKDNCLII